MDTIFALASARGKAGVAVFRISGPRAFAAGKALVGSLPAPHRAGLRRVVAGDEVIDEGLVLVFPEGESFTGEPVVELQVHGSVAVASALGRVLSEMAGLRLALPARIAISGVPALKGQWYESMMAQRMAGFWPLPTGRWRVFTGFHGGGFGKLPQYLGDFMTDFERTCGVSLDPVYTGKLCYALVSLAERGVFTPGQRLVLLHTGGLQGRRSLRTDSQIGH